MHIYIIKWREEEQDLQETFHHIRRAIKLMKKLSNMNIKYTLIHTP